MHTGSTAAVVGTAALGSPMSPCAPVDSEDAPLWPQSALPSTGCSGGLRPHAGPRCSWSASAGTQEYSGGAGGCGSGGGRSAVERQRAGRRCYDRAGGGGGPVAEASDPGRGGAPSYARPCPFIDVESDTSAGSLDGASRPNQGHAEDHVRGSGLTLEELMAEDVRQHALGRTLTAQMSLPREERRLSPGDYPPLVAVEGNVELLDNDAKVRPDSPRAVCVGVVIFACRIVKNLDLAQPDHVCTGVWSGPPVWCRRSVEQTHVGTEWSRSLVHQAESRTDVAEDGPTDWARGLLQRKRPRRTADPAAVGH